MTSALFKNWPKDALAAISVGILLQFAYSLEAYRTWMMTAAIVASACAATLSIYYSRMRERRLRRQQIFIIYTAKDRDAALRIASVLHARGHNPWLDVAEIVPGQKWIPAIERGINDSAVALLLWSKNVDIESSYVRKELEMAKFALSSKDESSSPIVPVKLDDTPLPRQLADVHWVDFRDEHAIAELENGLERIFGSPQVQH